MSGRTLVTPEWWSVVAVAYSDAPPEAVKAWRKTQIGRGHTLRAKDFDAAVSGSAKAGYTRATEMATCVLNLGIAPTLVVEEGHEWTDTERSIVARAKVSKLDPIVLQFDADSIVRVPAPTTSPRDLLRLGWRHDW